MGPNNIGSRMDPSVHVWLSATSPIVIPATRFSLPCTDGCCCPDGTRCSQWQPLVSRSGLGTGDPSIPDDGRRGDAERGGGSDGSQPTSTNMRGNVGQ